MQVRDGMSEVVLTVGPSHTLREAAAMMVEKGTGAALVTDDESPAPRIVTERDLLHLGRRRRGPRRRAGRRAHERQRHRRRAGLEPRARRGGDVAARRSATWSSSTDAELVGVLSMRDIVRVWTSDGATSGMTAGLS